MTTKKFFVLSFAVMILFAVIASGGCGSSGGGIAQIDGNTSQEDTTKTQIPDMSEVFDSPEFEQVTSELEQELRAEGIDPDTYKGPNIHFVMILSDDAVYLDNGLSSASAVRASGIAASETISDIGAKLSADYESGDVIALYFPTPEKINQLYEALGERPTYYTTQPSDERSYPEIYALAKRKGVSANHYFAYEVQGSQALLLSTITDILSSSDVSSSESYEVSGSADSGIRNEYLFQARRYVNFIKWTMLLDKRAAELDAGAVAAMSQFRAAADDSASFLDMSSQNFDGDAGYFEANYEPEYPVFAQPSTDIHYDSGFSFTVYSAHNYADKDDYYLFRSNAYTTPKNFKQNIAKGTALWGEYGYTRMFNVKAFVKDASLADVILMDNAPKTVNNNESISDGISTSIAGTFGQSQALDLVSSDTAQQYKVSNSLTYSNSQTWETKEWVLRNKSAGNSAEWAADLTGNESYVEAGTVRMSLESEWIWRVKNAFSLKSDSLAVDAELATRQGFSRHYPPSRKMSKYREVVDLCEREITTPKTINVRRPNQIFVGRKAFNAGKDGGTEIFTLLCNNDYAITSSQPSWCHVSDDISKGSDTGANERNISFKVDSFNADGAANTRSAVITVTDQKSGDKMEISVVQGSN